MWLSLVFVSILVSLTTVTMIMVTIACRRRQPSLTVNGLATVFYRDGISYFLIISGLAVVNIILGYIVPPGGLRVCMVIIQIHLTSILSGRMLIHLRECSRRDIQSGVLVRKASPLMETVSLGTIHFAKSGVTCASPISPSFTWPSISTEVPTCSRLEV
ncbi:hypothetical protein DFP72DRAFT_423438 [Ephemerocybe angulata]|uniref:Uncharacterized protein n=1 Tax=Ephemerocybe angulata TaxID=980116 RepID=A0A8H6IHW3_9AGAR|nr:hypothetical protein DFP72DRAFT_423438 [Tulosesus angulatus]